VALVSSAAIKALMMVAEGAMKVLVYLQRLHQLAVQICHPCAAGVRHGAKTL
jgi:hypothetical protein